MQDPMQVLAPNYMGDTLDNRGVDEISANYGLGVAEAQVTNQQAMEQREEASNPGMMMRDKLRTAKAREFGRTKETVGF